jgi:hypothetical protein
MHPIGGELLIAAGATGPRIPADAREQRKRLESRGTFKAFCGVQGDMQPTNERRQPCANRRLRCGRRQTLLIQDVPRFNSPSFGPLCMVRRWRICASTSTTGLEQAWVRESQTACVAQA